MSTKDTILIIEDNQLNLTMVKDLLDMAGFQTLEAEEAITGIELAKQHQPDLVLMDMHLPMLDGYEATRQLKADPKTQAIPVVAFTALAMEDEQTKALAAGSVGIICKPFDAKTFAKTVHSFLRGEHPQPDYTVAAPDSTPIQTMPPERKNHYSKILIVDDQPKNVQILTDILSSMNHLALPAFSRQDALDSIQREKPDLVLLDMMMPNMDGFAVLRHLQANPAFADIPIIIVSALAESDQVTKGLDEGAYDYITKPYHVPEVQARVRAALKTRRLLETVQQTKQDMEQFLMVASHDLQSPLRKIRQLSTFLRQSAEKKLDLEDLDFLSKIERNTADMEELLKSLLILSRVQRHQEAFTTTELNDAVASASKNLAGRIQAENAIIDIGVLPTIEADPAQVRILFEVLIDNALKFKRDEPPHIRIQASTDQGACTITIEDNGIGFDADRAESIFKPFYRLHGKYAGFGLGLTIAKKIVERHHGGITAQSQQGHGSTFTLTLPLPSEGF